MLWGGQRQMTPPGVEGACFLVFCFLLESTCRTRQQGEEEDAEYINNTIYMCRLCLSKPGLEISHTAGSWMAALAQV